MRGGEGGHQIVNVNKQIAFGLFIFISIIKKMYFFFLAVCVKSTFEVSEAFQLAKLIFAIQKKI
jgi:hypothetical protein